MTTAAATTQVFDNNMRGVLYKNDRRETPKHPNARGRAMVDGIWYWVSSWTQHSKTSGEKYQSMSFTRFTDEQVEQYINKRGQQQQAPQYSGQQAARPAQQAQQTQTQTVNPNAPATRADGTPVLEFDDEIPF